MLFLFCVIFIHSTSRFVQLRNKKLMFEIFVIQGPNRPANPKVELEFSVAILQHWELLPYGTYKEWFSASGLS